ncbi:hypothetical protein ACHAXR_000343 [Thalassiosira sp. AJA248-18]
MMEIVCRKTPMRLWNSGIGQPSLVARSHIAILPMLMPRGWSSKRTQRKPAITGRLRHAAMGGGVTARHNLGVFEMNAGNMNRAMKHFMISASYGYDDSLKEIKTGFSDGHVTKDDFEKSLRAHKESKDEMQSDQRDEARRLARSWESLNSQS